MCRQGQAKHEAGAPCPVLHREASQRARVGQGVLCEQGQPGVDTEVAGGTRRAAGGDDVLSGGGAAHKFWRDRAQSVKQVVQCATQGAKVRHGTRVGRSGGRLHLATLQIASRVEWSTATAEKSTSRGLAPMNNPTPNPFTNEFHTLWFPKGRMSRACEGVGGGGCRPGL